MVYNPTRPSDINTVEGLREYITQELDKISKEFNETIALDLRTVHVEPKRPREGMIVSADGTDWDPGSGAGAYEYINGVWRRVSGLEDGDYGDITVSGGNLEIDADTVGNTELANMAFGTVKARGTAGTGNPEDIPIGDGFQISATEIKTRQQMSITVDSSGLKLSGDEASPGNSQYYGTDSGGTKGFHALPSSATLISSVTPTGSSSQITWSGAYKILFIICEGISHNSGGTAAFQLEFSHNGGSSWGTAVSITSAVSGAAAFTFVSTVFNADLTNNKIVVTQGNAGNIGVSANPASAAAANGIRLSAGGNNFDAGGVYLYGL